MCYNIYSFLLCSQGLIDNKVVSLQVRSTDYSWKEAKKSLKKDSRWESAGALDREEREALFNLHVETLTKRKREKFRY